MPKMRSILTTERAFLVAGVCLPNVSIPASLCVYKSQDPVSVKSMTHSTPPTLIWLESREQEEIGSDRGRSRKLLLFLV